MILLTLVRFLNTYDHMQKTFTLFTFFLLTFLQSVAFSQPEKTIDSLEKVLVRSKDTARVSIALKIAYQYQRINTDKALEYAVMANEEAVRIQFHHGEAKSYKMLASIYQNKGDMSKAEKLAMIALEKLKIYGTVVEQADATNLLGLIFMGQAKYYQAEKYYKEALYSYIDSDDSVGVVIALHNIGVVNFYRGEYDQVARYYSNSLKLAEKLNSPKFISINQLNLGLLYSAQKDYSKAKRYIRQALIKLREMGDRLGEANAVVHLGSAYFNEGFMDSSFVCHQEALSIYREAGGTNGVSQCLNNLGDIMMERNMFKYAREYYSEALFIRRNNGDIYGMAISFTGLANVNYATGNLELAELYYDSALTISKAIGTVQRTADVYYSMANFHAKQGNYQRAFDAMKNYATFQDTIYDQKKLQVVQELDAKYQTEKAQEDLAIQKGKIKILRRSNNLFIFSLAALGIIIALIILLGVVSYKRTQIKNLKNLEIAEKNILLAESQQKTMQAELERSKAEQGKIMAELSFKKKELTQLALHISQQNDFLESLKNNLKEVSPTPEVRSLERELDAKINLDKQREDFELNVDLINQDFYRNLSEKFPQLSENEKKLCAMIRLNLSSKEIAAIQNISSKSVDMNRYRMRKKLNLTNEEDLNKFLSEI